MLSPIKPRLLPIEFDPFRSGKIDDAVLTTDSQLEIWSAAQAGSDASCAYNESLSIRLAGHLQVATMQLAINDLVNRHESLRTSFSGDGRWALINTPDFLSIPVMDWRSVDSSMRQASLSQLIECEVAQPFELQNGPLFRAKILLLEPTLSIVVLTAHHIICDGWSAKILVQELGEIYSARCNGLELALQTAPSFVKYAEKQQSSDVKQKQARSEAYWRQIFQDAETQLEFPFEFKRRSERSFQSSRMDWPIPKELRRQAEVFAAEHNVSFFVTLFAVFQVWLHRLTGQSEFVVGVPYAGQVAAGSPGLVGHLVNLLPIRAVIADESSLSAVVQSVQQTMVDALDNYEISLGRLLQILQYKRSSSQPPLVTVVFNVDQAIAQGDLNYKSCEVVYHSNPRAFENFDFFFNVAEKEGQLTLTCQYKPELMSREAMSSYLLAFESLLAALATKSQQTVATLPLFKNSEVASILSERNQTGMAYDRRIGIHELFERSVALSPYKVAVYAGFQALTYGELNRRANQLAHYLRSRGVQRGHTVGLAVDRSIDMLVAVLGILKSGAAYVPIDPHYPTERIQYMIEHSQLQVCVTNTCHLKSLPLLSQQVVVLDRDSAAISQCASYNLARDYAHAEDIAYVIYTSGSTGKPKGVQVPHRSVVNFLQSMQIRPGLTDRDRLLAITTLSFDIAVLELFLPLSVGAEVVIASRDEAADGQLLASLIARHQITILQATPATWRMLVANGWSGHPSLRALCGGEALTSDLVSELLPRVKELWNMYGPTETTVWSACSLVNHAAAPIVIGKPIGNTQFYILDNAMQLVPTGVRGEIYIGGDGITCGYLNRPDLTAERFIEAPTHLNITGRLYKTGDIGRWTFGGDIEFFQRNDTQVKIRGFRIELGEIQAVLALHPQVMQAVAIVGTDRKGDQCLVAYLKMNPGSHFDRAAMIAHMHSYLPHYMVARYIVCVPDFPLLPNGKLNYRALPAWDTQELALDLVESLLPRTAAEKRIAAIWADLLQKTDIRLNDNFFDLGGHSLLLVQVLQRIQAETGHRPQLALFLSNTLEQVAPHCGYEDPVALEKPQASTNERQWSPHFFGDPAAPLFGVHHLPHPQQGGNQAVLLCYPGSEEYMRVHWLYRQLAGQLTRAGFHVLRFDYSGMGDSSGETGTGQVAQWVDDIVTASAFLKTITGASKINIVGLRLGAALASAAVDRGFEVGKLVLWDPVVQGAHYLRETYRMQKDLVLNERHLPPFATKRDLMRFHESAGFPIGRHYKEQVARLDLTHHNWIAADQVHLVATSMTDQFRSLQQKFTADNGLIHLVDEDCGWGDFNKLRLTLFANRTLQNVVRVLAGGAP